MPEINRKLLLVGTYKNTNADIAWTALISGGTFLPSQGATLQYKMSYLIQEIAIILAHSKLQRIKRKRKGKEKQRPQRKPTMANATQAISSLLSQNNNVEIASLAATVLFGCVAVYGMYQQWRYRIWEKGSETSQTLIGMPTECMLFRIRLVRIVRADSRPSCASIEDCIPARSAS